jgi:hypothetical protein
MRVPAELMLPLASLLFPVWARADLVPLPIRPVSISLTISAPGNFLATGTSSATTSGSFSDPYGNRGSVSATVTTLADRSRVEASGVVSTSGGAASLDVYADLEVEFDVPDIGDAVTPVFFSLTNVTTSGGWLLPQLQAATLDFFSTFNSSQFGGFILAEAHPNPILAGFNTFWVWQQPFSSFLSLPAGDVVRFRTRIRLQQGQPAPMEGPFTTSAELVFRVPTPTIGTGDVNGDRFVDLLDSTLLRRRLAGLDPWP